MPSRPLAALAVTLIGIAYSLIVPGRWPDPAKWAIGVVLVVVGLARVYLAVDQPDRAIVRRRARRRGRAHGVPLVRAERRLPRHLPAREGGAPRRRWATGRGDRPRRPRPARVRRPRRQARRAGGIRRLDAAAAAGGEATRRRSPSATCSRSSTRRATCGPTAGTSSAARSCTARSRTSRPFQTVRRFVEYEDYTLRLMHDSGLPVPRARTAIVEITPEREYMIVMEFFDGAVEIGEAEVDDRVIDQGLAARARDVGRGPRAPRHQARQPHGAATASCS